MAHRKTKENQRWGLGMPYKIKIQDEEQDWKMDNYFESFTISDEDIDNALIVSHMDAAITIGTKILHHIIEYKNKKEKEK